MVNQGQQLDELQLGDRLVALGLGKSPGLVLLVVAGQEAMKLEEQQESVGEVVHESLALPVRVLRLVQIRSD